MVSRTKAGSSRPPRGSKRVKKGTDEPLDWREKTMANFRLYTRSSEKLAQNMQAEMMASCSAYRFQDVPIQVIADAVRTFLKQIQTRLRPPYRQKMFENIMADVPAEFASEAAWEKPLPPRRDQNTKVKTPFSEPKKKQPGSNAALIEALSRAAGFTSQRTRSFIDHMVWFDGMMSDHRWLLSNHKHELEDVPTCYVRDWIMRYIDVELCKTAEQRTPVWKMAVKTAVYTDLTADEITEYTALLVKIRAVEDPDSEDLEQDSHVPPIFRPIDETLDLTPHTEVIHRPKEPVYAGTFWRTAVYPTKDIDAIGPGWLPDEHPERQITLPNEIHHDCDQIRAMIKIFLLECDADKVGWTFERFWYAIGDSRKGLERFLRHRGPNNYVTCTTYRNAWAFFYRREKMGLPLRDAGPERDGELLRTWVTKQETPGLPEQTQQTRGKRRSTDGTEDIGDGGKRRKVGDN